MTARTEPPAVAHRAASAAACGEELRLAHLEDDEAVAEEREVDALDGGGVRAQQPALLEAQRLEVRLQDEVELLAAVEALAAHLGALEAERWERELLGGLGGVAREPAQPVEQQ